MAPPRVGAPRFGSRVVRQLPSLNRQTHESARCFVRRTRCASDAPSAHSRAAVRTRPHFAGTISRRRRFIANGSMNPLRQTRWKLRFADRLARGRPHHLRDVLSNRGDRSCPLRCGLREQRDKWAHEPTLAVAFFKEPLSPERALARQPVQHIRVDLRSNRLHDVAREAVSRLHINVKIQARDRDQAPRRPAVTRPLASRTGSSASRLSDWRPDVAMWTAGSGGCRTFASGLGVVGGLMQRTAPAPFAMPTDTPARLAPRWL